MQVLRLLFAILVTIHFGGCATSAPPSMAYSDAKLALAKSDTPQVRKYGAVELRKCKRKFHKLQKLIEHREYEEAKFLAKELQIDCRLLRQKVKRREVQAEVQQLQGKLNRVEENFVQIKEGEK